VVGIGSRGAVGRAGVLGAKVSLRTALLDANVPILVSGAKWTMPPKAENPSGLKVKYTAKNGSFKGSFKMSAGGKKSVKVTVTGVFVEGVGYGMASVKKAGGVAVTIK